MTSDIGNRLRVYENTQGKGFKRITAFDDPFWDGCWMGMVTGDLDGDLKDEVLLSNCGSQVFTVRNNAMFMEKEQGQGVQAMSTLNAIKGISNPFNHAVLRYDEREQRLSSIPTACRVIHSPVIPPDSTRKENIGKEALALFEKYNYSETLSGIEFAWGSALFDIDNDSDLDVYMAGSFSRGNDGFIGDWSGSPGRLLVNESRTGALQFRDLTLTYRLLDVSEIDYDANPPRRKAPGTNWHKRDSIYVTDTDSYSETGLEASQKSKIVDILRMHEAASGMVAGDLNQDGYEDLVVTHMGGYNSNLSSARNLKVKFMGKALAIPAPNKLNKPPTQFEEGPTFVYINGGPPEEKEPHWVNIRLFDESGFNRYVVGAKIIVNDKIMRRLTIGGHIFSGVMADLHIGLGDEDLKNIKVYWPSGEMDPQVITFNPPLSNERVCIDKDRGQLACQ
ncbi:MAG: hypothetical protein GKR87_08355 [Kiritimatiellae bacterium]|nr:hypothetical protein [Kiritimatiellia bacterium]